MAILEWQITEYSRFFSQDSTESRPTKVH